MARPRLMVGHEGTAELLEAENGYADNGIGYAMLAQTDPVAPAGPSGECAFTNLFLTTRNMAVAVTLRVTPIINGVDQEPSRLTLLPWPGIEPALVEHKISLMVDFLVNGVSQLTYAPRGQWFAARVETITEGWVEINEATVEYEVTRETIRTDATVEP